MKCILKKFNSNADVVAIPLMQVQVEEERMAKKMAADQEVLAESIERVERGKRLLGQAQADDKHSDVPSAEEVSYFLLFNL